MARIVFDGSSGHTDGDLPPVGSRAPDVSLVTSDLKQVSLANWHGQRKILNILTSIDIPACAESVLRFARLTENRDDIVLLAVSHDLPFAFAEFRKQHSLPNVAGLSGVRREGFGTSYGVLIVDGPLKGMYARAVVVLDENNTVVHREHLENVELEPDYAAACKALGIDIDPTAMRTE